MKKSINPKIARIYKEIEDNQYVDSDYWSVAGFPNIIAELNKFREEDFLELELEIKNWSSFQKGIFAETIITKNPNWKLTVEMDIGEWFTDIFLMVEDKDFDYFFGGVNGEWNLILNSNLEKLQKIKQRIIAFEKNNPPHIFNYKAIYQDLDNQILKLSK